MLAERLAGCYRGQVMDNDDPEGLLRIRVRVPQVLGDAVTDWAWPSIPVAVGVTSPAEGDPVWVIFEAGDINRPVWVGIWRTYRPGGSAPDINFGGVVAETTFGLASSNGTATTLARSDHTHGSPTNPVPAHEAAANPHPVYATDADLTATMTAHTGSSDPHPAYATDTDLAAHAATPHGSAGDVQALETLFWAMVNP